MVRKNGRRRSKRVEEDPMTGIANLVDAMLVIAVGFLVFVIISWNMQAMIDPDQSMQEAMQQQTTEVDQGQQLNETPDTSNSSGQGYTEMGKVYKDPATGKLIMVDDDLDMNALTKTNYVKSIVTAELRMDLERKKEQSYQGRLYVRFLCFGNGALTALHDRSDGFFRRQIILTTKDKPADRFDDPFLAEKLIAEKEGIFLWMLEGLRRLIANHYHFTISQRAKDNITSAVRDANNILDFLDSEGYVAFKADYEASTKNLYAAYKRWCEDNAENPLSPKSFANQLSQNAERYHLEPVNNLHIGGGKRCRGYMGIYVLLSPMEL